MARFPDAIAFREWALDHSPAALNKRALRLWDVLAPHFGKSFSPLLMEFWRAGIFTDQTDADRRQYDSRLIDGFTQGKLVEELLLFDAWAERLSVEMGVPVVTDRPPFRVAVDRIHIFDVPVPVIREVYQETVTDSTLLAQLKAFAVIRNTPPPTNEFARWNKLRPLLDMMIPTLLRSTEGSGIHNELTRRWIFFNARAARYAAVPSERDAAEESLEKIHAALLPSPLAARGPNSAGLASDYLYICQQVQPIIRKRYRNPQLRAADLHKKLERFERSLIDRFAHLTTRQFALELLSATYGLKPGYIRNRIKRGRLFIHIVARWRDALLPPDWRETLLSNAFPQGTPQSPIT